MARLLMEWRDDKAAWPPYWQRFMREITDRTEQMRDEEPVWMSTSSFYRVYKEAKRRMCEEYRMSIVELDTHDQLILEFETEADLSRFLLTWS